VDILKWLKSVRFSFTLDNLFVFFLLVLLFLGIIYLIFRLLKGKINIRTITVKGISIDLQCDAAVKNLAHKVWIELSTRKIALPFDEDNDVIVEVYDSWYKVFEKFRDILKELPSQNDKCANKLSEVIMKVLNEELREHLTKWQARFRKWYEMHREEDQDPQEIQKKYPKYEELVSDLKKVNKEVIKLTEELDKIRREK